MLCTTGSILSKPRVFCHQHGRCLSAEQISRAILCRVVLNTPFLNFELSVISVETILFILSKIYLIYCHRIINCFWATKLLVTRINLLCYL